jgi:hypothetical protein
MHMPLLQVLVVHEFPSSHWPVLVQDAQPAIGAVVQPLAGSQLSVVQPFPSLQVSAVPAAHVPDWQVSAPLHALPSPHAVPLATAG